MRIKRHYARRHTRRWTSRARRRAPGASFRRAAILIAALAALVTMVAAPSLAGEPVRRDTPPPVSPPGGADPSVDPLVAVACSQVGSTGGDLYWSWYGFHSRVEWCACFISWCANECGYIDGGIVPKFAAVSDGVTWFREHGQWRDNTYTPSSGDIVFFDWEGDGQPDHVGIVERCEDGSVFTIEGNSGDSCAENSYALDSAEIFGYGIPL